MRVNDEKGVAIIEAAICLPLLILLMLSCVEVCRMLHMKQELTNINQQAMLHFIDQGTVKPYILTPHTVKAVPNHNRRGSTEAFYTQLTLLHAAGYDTTAILESHLPGGDTNNYLEYKLIQDASGDKILTLTTSIGYKPLFLGQFTGSLPISASRVYIF